MTIPCVVGLSKNFKIVLVFEKAHVKMIEASYTSVFQVKYNVPSQP